jgi:hypothetical protein
MKGQELFFAKRPGITGKVGLGLLFGGSSILWKEF